VTVFVVCCQVIDEADRMMDEIKQGWLEQLERAVYGDNETSHDRHLPGPLTAARFALTLFVYLICWLTIVE
jgi:hypothetical protein